MFPVSSITWLTLGQGSFIINGWRAGTWKYLGFRNTEDILDGFAEAFAILRCTNIMKAKNPISRKELVIKHTHSAYNFRDPLKHPEWLSLWVHKILLWHKNTEYHFLLRLKNESVWWIKDLNVRPEATELLEKNIGKTLSDINHSRILYDPPPRILEIKAKIKQMLTKEWIKKMWYYIYKGILLSH